MPAEEPSLMPKAPPPNRFTVETEFLEHYDLARTVARHSENWTPTYLGEDLLGVPAREDGHVVRDANRRVVWKHRPRAGCVPVDADGKFWREVPFLAPYLQSTLLIIDPQLNIATVSTRLTPEVRLVKSGLASMVPMRTLTTEINVVGDDTLRQIEKRRMTDFRERLAPLLKLWMPLHDEVSFDWFSGPPQPMRIAGLFTAGLMIRFSVPHEMIT